MIETSESNQSLMKVVYRRKSTRSTHWLILSVIHFDSKNIAVITNKQKQYHPTI